MGKLVFIFLFLGIDFAFAGYSCNTNTGETVNIFSSHFRGVGASVQSKEVTNYYKKNLNIQVDKLRSFLDPETKKYATEKSNKGYLFALGIDESEIDNIWSLDFAFKSGWNATAILTDTNGTEFNFDLTCKQTPDLE